MEGRVVGGDGWQIPEREEERARELVRALGLSPVTGHLLVRRGIADPARARAFLDPQLASLHEPDGLPDVAAAVARLEAAIAGQEPVLLFGDYDVDGITGAAILHEVLSEAGARVEVHIPDRSEGYGLNLPRLERAVGDGVRVVISIDNGIAALEEAEFLAERGVDLIVCDHHTLRTEGERVLLPRAVARIHPRLPGSTYANPHLCGAGVAFKLAWAVAKKLGGGRASKRLQEALLRCMGLVALGTIADVVPLVDENRVLVRYGLRALAGSGAGRPGLRALLASARIEGVPDTMDVGFRLAPRLNAAGRMGQARRAFELLVTRDPARGQALAEELDRENTRRRALQKQVFEAARAQVVEVYGAEPRSAGIVVWGDDWPHGIVGIVAAKLTEEFHRPALVAAVEGERAKGSGRTAGGIDLLGALQAARGELLRSGGHQAAVGFTVEVARLPALREAFDRGVRDQVGLAPEADAAAVVARLRADPLRADAEVRLGELSRQLLDELSRLGPFGQGNDEPLFCARRVRLAGEPRLMGERGDHVSFMLRQGDDVLRAVAFGRRDLWEALRRTQARPGEALTFEVAFRPRLNRWKGETSVELELTDINL